MAGGKELWRLRGTWSSVRAAVVKLARLVSGSFSGACAEFGCYVVAACPGRLLPAGVGSFGTRMAHGVGAARPNIGSGTLAMMKKVYLDFTKWVDLARAEAGQPNGLPFRNALTMAKAGVEEGLVTFPLSVQHYMEVNARSRAGPRLQIGTLMLKLSKRGVMADVVHLVPCEIDQSLRKLFGRPTNPRTCQVFGLSLSEVLEEPSLRYQPPPGANLTPGQEVALNRMMAAYLLVGPADGTVIPGYDPQAHREAGRRFAHNQRELVEKTRDRDREGKRELLLRHSVGDIIAPLEEALTRAGISATEFAALGTDGMFRFLRAMPSRWADFRLLYQHHLNPELTWRDNDLVDLTTLGLALAYCDIVVAEKFWADMARRAHLDELYGTTLLTDLKRLPELLAA